MIKACQKFSPFKGDNVFIGMCNLVVIRSKPCRPVGVVLIRRFDRTSQACFLIAVYYILTPHSAGGQPRWSLNVALERVHMVVEIKENTVDFLKKFLVDF